MMIIKKSKIYIITIFCFICFVFLPLQVAFAKQQTTCPVMGGPINKEIYTDYENKRIYFCCAGCVKTFESNPEKYINKMKNDGVELENAPEADTAEKALK